MHLNVMFSNESDLKKFQDFLYQKSHENVTFTGLLEAMCDKVTIVTAIHDIKSNHGSKTSGVDGKNINNYLQMDREELFTLIQSRFQNYKPKPARREYIAKNNGKEVMKQRSQEKSEKSKKKEKTKPSIDD